MTTVFFLFLLHLALGLMAMLPFVPERAGARFFKLCSAAGGDHDHGRPLAARPALRRARPGAERPRARATALLLAACGASSR